jgi:hypothetical protein
MGALMTHIEHLSEEIGPRPAASDAEAQAADYIRGVFESRGIDTEIQQFSTPRTYSWAFVLYHLFAIAAAVGSHWYPIPALVVALLTALLLRFDLDTRFGLSSIMPKRESQNVIARHEPKVGRGERVPRVVIVAHYDSARASLAFSPGMVKSFAATFGLMKWCTYLLPVLILARMLPYVDKLEPWAWYVTLVPAAYLVVPLLINIHREIFMRFTPGANDNASGVAAMLGVFERLVPEPDAATMVARETARFRTEEDAFAADVVPSGAALSYAPAAAPQRRLDTWNDDDVSWDTGVIAPGQADQGAVRPPTVSVATDDGFEEPDADESERLFGTGAMPRVASTAPAPGAVSDWGEFDDEDLTPPRPPRRYDRIDDERSAAPEPAPSPRTDDGSAPEQYAPPEPVRPRRGGDRGGVRDWLGIEDDFDARKAGKDIGSWDALAEDDEESGHKGGAAAIEGLDDPGFAASEAARIRRKVTMNVDRELVEKEVWFVATGAEEVGTVGMKALLKEFEPDLRDAAIINLDNLGAGNLHYITREGMAKHYSSDRRLLGAAKRAARESGQSVTGREYRGLSTDATPALARGFRAMSVMAFDINGRLPNWHWATDTAEEVSEKNLEDAVDFVSAVIKEL